MRVVDKAPRESMIEINTRGAFKGMQKGVTLYLASAIVSNLSRSRTPDRFYDYTRQRNGRIRTRKIKRKNRNNFVRCAKYRTDRWERIPISYREDYVRFSTRTNGPRYKHRGEIFTFGSKRVNGDRKHFTIFFTTRYDRMIISKRVVTLVPSVFCERKETVHRGVLISRSGKDNSSNLLLSRMPERVFLRVTRK